MASLPRRLLLQSRQCPSRIRARAAPKHSTQWQRPISSTPRRCAEDDAKEGSAAAAPASEQLPQTEPESKKKESPEDWSRRQLAKLASELKAMNPDSKEGAARESTHGIPIASTEDLEGDDEFEIPEHDRRKVAAGFWAEGEESMGPDEDFFGDDITSDGHHELRQHRDLREYSRMIAWDMPLLSQLSKPFTPPTAETPFRFRYTSYLHESHPAANKVVVEFSPFDLSLPPKSQSKMIKLAGPRYNPSSKLIKLSCEAFDLQAQNKRFLGQTIQALVDAAKDLKDDFEDVPFDFRHHKPKKFFEFPKEWVLTPERKKYLEEKRAEKAKLEDEKKGNSMLIDGKKVIETSLPFAGTQANVEEPILVGAGLRRR